MVSLSRTSLSATYCYHHYQWLWNLHRWYLYPGHRSLQHTTIITISGCGIFIDGIFIPDIALCNILLSSLSVAVESSSMVSLSRTSLSATYYYHHYQWLWNLHRWYLYPGHRSLQHTAIITISGCGIFIDGIFIPDIALCNIHAVPGNGSQHSIQISTPGGVGV